MPPGRSLPFASIISASGPSGRLGVSEIARRHPASRPVRARAPDSMSIGVGARPLVQRAALGGVVDDLVDGDDRRRPGAGHAERGALPENDAVPIDDACRVEHLAAREPVVEPAGETEGDDRALGQRAAGADSDDGGSRPQLAGDALLRPRRAGERHPVKVQAMLRTVSLMLEVAAKAAAGSKPQWIAQCSQRGSLPGPYISHSMPSMSAS